MPDVFSKHSADSTPAWIISCSVIVLCILYALRLGPMPLYPMWSADPAIYLVTAKSLSTGNGHRLICFPDEPPSTKYPIGYPLVLSSVIKVFGLDAIGLTLIRLVSVFAALCHYLLNIRLFRFYFSNLLSILAALAIAVSPLTFELAGEIMAEELFGAVWTLVLILTIKVVRSLADDRRTFLLATALGIAASAALLLRTIGIAVIAGMLFGLAMNRRWKLCMTAGLVVGMAVSPWILWSTVNGGGTFRSYATENAIAIYTPLKNAKAIALDVLPAILLPPLQTQAFESYVPFVIQSALCLSIGVAATSIGFIGAYSGLRRRDVIVPAVVPYLLIILLWWWEPSRFLLPAYPILAILFLSGCGVIFDAFRRVDTKLRVLAPCILSVVSILGGLAVDSTRLHAVWKYHHWAGASEAASWKAIKEALDWISTNTSQQTLCVSAQPEALYLLTNRRCLALPVTVEAMEHLFERLPKDSIVFATSRPNFESSSREEFAYSGIRTIVGRSPRLLAEVWRSPTEQVAIYRLRRPLCSSEKKTDVLTDKIQRARSSDLQRLIDAPLRVATDGALGATQPAVK